MNNTIVFSHAGANVEGTHDGGFGYDWTASLGGVLIAKGWIRGDDIEAHDAIVALITDLDFEQHVSKPVADWGHR
jgi:hypothetical protein